MSFETEDEVERLIAGCVERIGAERPAALDAMVAEHPEHAALEAWQSALSRLDAALPAARAPLQAEVEALRARIEGVA